MYTSYALKKWISNESIIEADEEEDKSVERTKIQITPVNRPKKTQESERIWTLIHGIVRKTSFRKKK